MAGFKKKILLLAMPWQRADAPSIQLGLLSAALKERGLEVKTWPAAPRLAKILGSLYWKVANNLFPLLGEAFFAAHRRPDFPQAAFERALAETRELTPRQIKKIQRGVETFLRDLQIKRPWAGFDAAGFSVTFNQLQASLWAAEEAQKDGCRVVFGGFLAHGDLGRELLARNDFIDAVISGPGERALPAWLLADDPPDFVEADPEPLWLEPDYDEYFQNLSASDLSKATLLLEASRGCEHGACAFCAQNIAPGRLACPPERLKETVDGLARRYPSRWLEFVDTSFPPEILADPALRESLGRFKSFTECRALTAREMAHLAEAGFKSVQVGVESLHPTTLKKINKGASLLDNLACLRDSALYKLTIIYNIILDLPGTTKTELEETAALLPSLQHLPPPRALVPFQLQRGSPIFRRPESHGLTITGPHSHHEFLGPGHPPLYFDYVRPSPLAAADLEAAHLAYKRWHELYDSKAPLLTARGDAQGFKISDRRVFGQDSGPLDYRLEPPASRILAACRKPQKKEIVARLAGPDLEAVLDGLAERKLILAAEGQYLALPVFQPRKGRWPAKSRPEPLDSYFAPDQD